MSTINAMDRAYGRPARTLEATIRRDRRTSVHGICSNAQRSVPITMRSPALIDLAHSGPGRFHCASRPVWSAAATMATTLFVNLSWTGLD
ncbi:hypothetical protein DTO282E5_4783 [Paecilomyces variotii]|nr:hypothetical protein DTO282E5_4783 [Paecilomyces variotii]